MNIFRISLPLPGLGIESVNVYLVGKLLVDSGLYSIRTLHGLARGLKGFGLKLCDVEAVVVTHFHVDHASLLPLLWDACSIDIYMGWGDWEIVRGGAARFVEEIIEIYKSNGVPPEELSFIIENHPVIRLRDVYEDMLPHIDVKPLRENDVLSLEGYKLRVVETPGHTPGSITLLGEGGEAFVGDLLIEDITPHVVIHRRSEDPLGEHLKSLKRIEEIKPRIAYPGHRNPVENPARRAREIIEFHESRLREILEILKEKPMTGYEVAKRVRWRVKYRDWSEYPPTERFFAIGEAIAHLQHLKQRDLVDQYEEKSHTYWHIKK